MTHGTSTCASFTPGTGTHEIKNHALRALILRLENAATFAPWEVSLLALLT
jgi:hypothetical protein